MGKFKKMDILKLMLSNIILPLQSWTLKDVSNWLGWIEAGDERDGFWAGKVYELYFKHKKRNINKEERVYLLNSNSEREFILNKLINHCIDDVKKLSFVSAWFRSILVNRDKYI